MDKESPMLDSSLNTENTPENRKLNGDKLTDDKNNFVQFESKEGNLHYDGVFDIDPKELAKKMNEVCLIDVRQPEEFTGELGHIPNTQLIVLDVLNESLDQLPKNKTIVFICRSGGRSARASAIAQQNGFTSVYNLKGGMLLWNDLHLPTEM